METTVLRHVKPAERPGLQRHTQFLVSLTIVGALIWSAYLLYQVAFQSKLSDPLRVVLPDFLMFVAVILMVLLSWRRQKKQALTKTRQYLYIFDNAIALNEKATADSAGDHTVWRVSRTELERVYPSPTGGMRFVLVTKAASKADSFQRLLGTKQIGHRLSPQDWVNVSRPSGLKPKALAFQFSTQKKLVAAMLTTDLGQALVKHGFL